MTRMVKETPVAIATRAVVLGLVLLFFAWGFFESLNFRTQSMPTPLFISAVGSFISLILVIIEVTRWRRERAIAIADDDMDATERAADDPFASAPLRSALGHWATFIGYIALVWVVGFHIGSFVFLVGSMLARGEMKWPKAVAASGLVVGVLITLEFVYGLQLPPPFWL